MDSYLLAHFIHDFHSNQRIFPTIHGGFLLTLFYQVDEFCNLVIIRALIQRNSDGMGNIGLFLALSHYLARNEIYRIRDVDFVQNQVALFAFYFGWEGRIGNL